MLRQQGVIVVEEVKRVCERAIVLRCTYIAFFLSLLQEVRNFIFLRIHHTYNKIFSAVSLTLCVVPMCQQYD